MEKVDPNHKKQRPISPVPVVKLSSCVTDYVRALLDPFEGPLACIPQPPCVESRKSRFWVKGTMTIGTSGFGFVMVAPLRMAANDSNSVYFNDGLYAGVNTSTAGVGVSLANSNSSYNVLNFGDPVANPGLNQTRVVAAGVRLRYTGSELTKSGLTYPYFHRTNGSVVNQNVVNFYGNQGYEARAVTRAWTSVEYRPVNDSDYIYSGAVSSANFNICILVTGTPGNTYEFDCCSVLEISGRNVTAMTPTHADPIGMQATQAVMSSETSAFSPFHGSSNSATHTAKALAEISEYLKFGVSTVQMVYRALN